MRRVLPISTKICIDSPLVFNTSAKLISSDGMYIPQLSTLWSKGKVEVNIKTIEGTVYEAGAIACVNNNPS